MHPENASLNKFTSSISRADIFLSQKYLLQMAFCRKDWGGFLYCHWTKLKCSVQLQNISGKQLITKKYLLVFIWPSLEMKTSTLFWKFLITRWTTEKYEKIFPKYFPLPHPNRSFLGLLCPVLFFKFLWMWVAAEGILFHVVCTSKALFTEVKTRLRPLFTAPTCFLYSKAALILSAMTQPRKASEVSCCWSEIVVLQTPSTTPSPFHHPGPALFFSRCIHLHLPVLKSKAVSRGVLVTLHVLSSLKQSHSFLCYTTHLHTTQQLPHLFGNN